MASSRSKKEEAFKTIQDRLETMKGMVLVDYKGIEANDLNDLRGKAHAENVEYTVCKKTILQKAFQEKGIEINVKEMEGQVAYAISTEDEVTPAKIIADFAKEHEEMNVLAGILEGNILSEEEVKNLAKLPSKEQLRGQVVGTLNAPISGFVNVLAGNIRGIVNVLNAIKDQKEA